MSRLQHQVILKANANDKIITQENWLLYKPSKSIIYDMITDFSREFCLPRNVISYTLKKD